MDVNLWGMLGCAVTYAAAIFAAVEAIGDHVVHRRSAADADAKTGLRLKTGSKVAAAGIGVLFAAVVLAFDGNWIALAVLSALFIGIVLWAFYVYREGTRVTPRRE